MANENKIEEIIRTSLENMRSMVDANTVIGNPYVTPGGVTVIPVSKISVGFASGGVDYFGKHEKPSAQNFGGGGGSGLSVVPVGFLVISAEGKVDMSQMITHVFPLADAEKAFELGAHPTDDVVKILIEMA